MKKLFYIFFLLAAFACVRENVPVEPGVIEPENEYPVYKELPNPHSTDVAQAVLDSLGIEDIEIKPSHKYVRIKVMPGDTLQMSLLEDDLGLALFDCPLDVDIPEGEEYIDETFVDGEPTWYYTVVGYDYSFPENTIYEVLIGDAYIPEPDLMVRNLDGNMVELEELMYERMGYDLAPETRSGRGKKPTGYVVMDDPVLKEDIKIKHIRVKIYNFLHIDDVWTDDNGKFTADEKFYANTVRYTVVYLNEDDRFVVRCTGGSRAKYQLGKHGYNYTIRITEKNQGDAWRWTAIYNSAWDYYKMCKDSQIPNAQGCIKIWYKSYAESSGAPGLARIVNIGGKNVDNVRMYYLVQHELAHTSHYEQAGYDNYWRHYIDYIVKCNTFDDDVYGDGTRNNHGYCEVGEMWGYAMGYFHYYERYYTASLRNTYPVSSPVSGWIHPDPLWALITRGVLTKKQVFDCLTTDVNTVEKLRARMISRHSDKTDLINEAFDSDNVLMPPAADEIVGLNSVFVNERVSYTSPLNSFELSFRSYTITGGKFQMLSSATNRNLNIQFSEPGEYSIIANYATSGGVLRTTTRTVNVIATPTVSASFKGSPIATGQQLYFSDIIDFKVTNVQPNVSYEWEYNGKSRRDIFNDVMYPEPSFSMSVVATSDTDPTAYLRCRAIGNNNRLSDWSNELIIKLSGIDTSRPGEWL